MLFKELSGYIYIFEIFTVTIKNVTLNIFYFQKRPVTFFLRNGYILFLANQKILQLIYSHL